jgi:DNA-binding transcriptional ArsR family regulator
MPKKNKLEEQKLELLAQNLLVIGDRSRLKILCLIFHNKKICVTDIAEKLGLSIAIVSHHLQVLSKAGILTCVREGKKNNYCYSPNPFVADLKRLICKYVN